MRVLDIDTARVCAGKITDQFFKRRRILRRVVGKQREQLLRLCIKAAALDTEDRPILCRKRIDQANADWLEVCGITRNHG